MTPAPDAFPVARYLVSAAPPPLPRGFTDVTVVVTTGLPLAVSLSRDISVIVSIPTGQARSLLDGDPSLTVSASADELSASTPSGEPVASLARTPARLYVQQQGVTIGSVPLALGTYWRAPDAGDPASGTIVEIVVLAWKLALGDLVSAGNFGSSIRIAWRVADLGAPMFEPPPISPRIVSTLRGGRATQSQLVPASQTAPSGYSWWGSPSAAPPARATSDGSAARAYEAFYSASIGANGV